MTEPTQFGAAPVEGEAFSHPVGSVLVSDNMYSGGFALKITDGQAVPTKQVVITETSEVTIRARAGQSGGSPTLTLRIDGVNSGTKRIQSTDLVDYKYELDDLEPGIYTLGLKAGDVAQGRNVFVDVVSFPAVEVGPPPPADEGRIYFVTRRYNSGVKSEIASMKPDGTDVRRVTYYPEGVAEWIEPSEVAVSPDGSKIAYRREDGSPTVADADGANAVTDPTHTSHRSLAWSPDGTMLVLVGQAVEGQSWHSAILKRSADLQQAPSLVVDTPSGSDELPAWGANNRIYWTSDVDGLQATDPDGTDVALIELYGRYADVSPDGSRLAYVNNSSNALVVCNSDGSGKQEIVTPPALSYFVSVSWSPDGSRLVVGRQIGSQSTTSKYEIAVVDADGGNYQVLTSNTESYPNGDFHPEWAPSPPL